MSDYYKKTPGISTPGFPHPVLVHNQRNWSKKTSFAENTKNRNKYVLDKNHSLPPIYVIWGKKALFKVFFEFMV